MKFHRLLCLFALLLALPLGITRADESKTEQKKPNRLVPLIIPVASSDIGVGVAGVGIYTWNKAGRLPYYSQFVVAAGKTTLGLEALTLNLNTPNVAGSKYRLRMGGGFLRSRNSPWFGYGNQANSQYIQDVEKGELPGPGNFQRKPDILKAQEASLNEDFFQSPANGLNPGRRWLEESQNRFYRYEISTRTGGASLERQLGQSLFKLRAGIALADIRVDSYQGDREKNNSVPNRATLLDLEQPVGYDALQGARMVNSFKLQLAYDTVSPEREVNPDRGLRIGIKSETAGKVLGSDYDFQRYTGYIYGYLPLFDGVLKPRARELILALRLQASQYRGAVPFFASKGLGGRKLRGFPGNRFVDNIIVFWGAELRYSFARFKSKKGDTDLYGLIFFDQGRSAHSRKDLTAKDFHEAAGVGLGVIVGQNAVVELVVGASQFESYFELSVGHTFKAY